MSKQAIVIGKYFKKVATYIFKIIRNSSMITLASQNTIKRKNLIDHRFTTTEI